MFRFCPTHGVWHAHVVVTSDGEQITCSKCEQETLTCARCSAIIPDGEYCRECEARSVRYKQCFCTRAATHRVDDEFVCEEHKKVKNV